jgi:hypothetical protein
MRRLERHLVDAKIVSRIEARYAAALGRAELARITRAIRTLWETHGRSQ